MTVTLYTLESTLTADVVTVMEAFTEATAVCTAACTDAVLGGAAKARVKTSVASRALPSGAATRIWVEL